ncbi:hypothetical protein VTN02DRAFT_6599 [Thermoascus thermophilus]
MSRYKLTVSWKARSFCPISSNCVAPHLARSVGHVQKLIPRFIRFKSAASRSRRQRNARSSGYSGEDSY